MAAFIESLIVGLSITVILPILSSNRILNISDVVQAWSGRTTLLMVHFSSLMTLKISRIQVSRRIGCSKEQINLHKQLAQIM